MMMNDNADVKTVVNLKIYKKIWDKFIKQAQVADF